MRLVVLNQLICLSYDELEEAFEELHESFQKLMSKYNALKKKHSNLSSSYDKLELKKKDNNSKIQSLKEKINHMIIENRFLKRDTYLKFQLGNLL